jgi:predicted MFS family arabinose efflux permease
MAVYATCRLWGPAIGPVIGAYLARAEGWRWLFWLVAIASGCLAICCFVALPETTPAIILARKARRLRRKTGNERYQSKLGPSSLSLNEHLRAIRRPARVILLSPIVLCTSICAGVVFGEIYILYTTFTRVFERTYDFSTGAAGLSFLGIGVGMTLGAMLSPLNDRIVKRLTLRANGVFRPEMRLPAMMISSSLIGIGFVLYGWTLQYKVHYMVPIVGTSFIGGGAVLFLVITQEYLMLAFPTYAIDAFAAIIVVREIMAGVLPLAGWKIYEHLGYGWGNTLLASLALLLIPISWVLYLYGERVRNKHPLKL